MLFSFSPLAFIHCPSITLCKVPPVPILQIIFVVSLISISIWPLKIPITLNPAFYPLPFVNLSVSIGKLPFPIEVIIFEIALVDPTIGKLVSPETVFLAIDDIAFVDTSISPKLLASAIWQVVCPFAFVNVPVGLVREYSFTICDIMIDISFVVRPVTVDQPPLSMRSSILERPLIVTPIRKKQLANSMWFLLNPLPNIYNSCIGYFVWSRLNASLDSTFYDVFAKLRIFRQYL